MAKRVKRARLVKTKSGMVPAGDGWFVVNATKSVWRANEKFGASTYFEGRKQFGQLGINIHVVEPGQPNCHYHGESQQEDFLVLSGRCRLLIEGQELRLKAWDFVHCPPWTEHVFVGAGKEPCAILMVGARLKNEKVRYPRSDLALKYDAGAEKTTNDPRVSYANVPRSRRTRAPRGFGAATSPARRGASLRRSKGA